MGRTRTKTTHATFSLSPARSDTTLQVGCWRMRRVYMSMEMGMRRKESTPANQSIEATPWISIACKGIIAPLRTQAARNACSSGIRDITTMATAAVIELPLAAAIEGPELLSSSKKEARMTPAMKDGANARRKMAMRKRSSRNRRCDEQPDARALGRLGLAEGVEHGEQEQTVERQSSDDPGRAVHIILPHRREPSGDAQRDEQVGSDEALWKEEEADDGGEDEGRAQVSHTLEEGVQSQR
eukprot:3936952-Rhodomonas_salina.3